MHNLVSNPQKVPNLKLAESFQTAALTTASNIFNHITAQVVGVLWRPSGSNSTQSMASLSQMRLRCSILP